MTETMWVDLEFGLAAKTGAASHVGNYRENNEDCVHVDSEYPFALVLDGMGGMAAGELASQRGAEAVRDAIRHGFDSGTEPRPLIESSLRIGHEAVLEAGRSDRSCRGCGTTIVLALLHRGVAYVSWLGDSPAFRIGNGRIEKLTWDHDLRTAMVRSGIIRPDEVSNCSIKHMLWQYLGSEEKKQVLEIPSFAPYHGDRLLLATDGITGVLSEEQLREVCESHPDPNECAEELVSRALDQGSRDNCSCVVIAFERDRDPEPETPRAARKWWQFWK